MHTCMLNNYICAGLILLHVSLYMYTLGLFENNLIMEEFCIWK